MGLRHFLRDPFEYDFRKLNAKLNTTDEAKQFGRSLDDLFGRWPSPTVILADDLSEVELIEAAIRRSDEKTPGGKVIGQIMTIYDVLPGRIRRRSGASWRCCATSASSTHDPALGGPQRQGAGRPRQDRSARRICTSSGPWICRRSPAARSPRWTARVGKLVLVYPVEQGSRFGTGATSCASAASCSKCSCSNGKEIESSGFAVVFGAMIRSILHDGPIATLASLIAVLVIIAFTIRPSRGGAVALGNADRWACSGWWAAPAGPACASPS